MRFRVIALILAGMAGFAATPDAGAQDAAPVIKELRAVDGMPAALKDAFAQTGEPDWVFVADGPTTLSEAISNLCGEQTANVRSALEAEAMQLNALATVDDPVPQGTTIAIPYCLPFDKDVTVTVQPGDTVETLLKEHSGVYGPKTLRKTYELNRKAIGRGSPDRFFRNLSIGQEIRLPAQATPRVYVARTAETDLEQLVDELAAGTAQVINTTARQVDPADAPLDEVNTFKLVESVKVASLDGETACGSDEDIGAPIDMTALKAVFDEEKRRMAAAGETMGSARLGIIDTGLQRPEDGFFSVDVMIVNTREMEHRQDGVDDDRDNDTPPNDAIDDVFGINFNRVPMGGYVQPYMTGTDSWRFHGTRMASLLLGGPSVIEQWGAERPPIRLRVVNFTRSTREGGMSQPYNLNRAIAYLQKGNVGIVNMSLSSTQNFEGTRNSMYDNKDMLFVAAAGNRESGASGDIAFSALYPARYGGRRGDNVITVGAHGRSGARASFSNFSSEFVDILAPGCGIDTRDGDGATVRDSGTSPAAALVSFTAGLLKAAGVEEAAAIKTRILAAVDYDEKLADDAWSRGRLNAVKTLSLRRDAVQTTDGGLQFGIIEDKTPLFELCDDPNSDFSHADDVYKVVANIETAGGTKVEYWIYTDGLLSRRRCAQKETSNTIRLDDAPVPISNIRDVVFKWL